MYFSIDAAHTLASYLEREWGSTRYMTQMVPGPYYGSALAECNASDGSVWWIATDRHGAHKVHGDTREEAAARLVVALEAAQAQTQGITPDTVRALLAERGQAGTPAEVSQAIRELKTQTQVEEPYEPGHPGDEPWRCGQCGTRYDAGEDPDATGACPATLERCTDEVLDMVTTTPRL